MGLSRILVFTIAYTEGRMQTGGRSVIVREGMTTGYTDCTDVVKSAGETDEKKVPNRPPLSSLWQWQCYAAPQ